MAYFRSLNRRPRGDDGVTLAEMSVTMLVLSLFIGCVVVMVSAGEKTSLGVKERMDQSNMATISIERISRNLRTAVLQSQLTSVCTLSVCLDAAFLQGTPTSVQFYADVDNPRNTIGPSKVTYSVVGGVLTETVQKPDSPTPDAAGYHYCTTGSTCQIRTTVLARSVDVTTVPFTYYNATDPVNAMTLTAGALSSEQLKTVDTIDVQVKVQIAGGANVGGASVVQRVALPNHDSVVRTDVSTP